MSLILSLRDVRCKENKMATYKVESAIQKKKKKNVAIFRLSPGTFKETEIN